MRYIKVLLLVLLIFFSLVFFFQNQTALSTAMTLKLNLFFVPEMTSIPLPFYFIVIVAFFVGALLAVALLAAGFNPLFNHEGATILGYWPSGNPLTLESVLYGGGTALMLLAALGWFSCLNRVMTADKWMCLVGRALPTLSLLLSMTLRLVPRFRARLEEIRRDLMKLQLA